MTNEIPDGCIAFDLKLALEGWPVVTRDEKEVIDLKFWKELDDIGMTHPIEALIKGEYCTRKYQKSGHIYTQPDTGKLTDCDLFLKKKTKTYYANVLKIEGDKGLKIRDICVDKNITLYHGTSDPLYQKTISFELDDTDTEQPKTKKLWIAIEKNHDEHGTHCVSTANRSELVSHSKNSWWHVQVEVPIE